MITKGITSVPHTPKGFITKWTVSGDATARTITLPLPLLYNVPFNGISGVLGVTVTISSANPGVVTKTSHGLIANTPIYFTSTGTLPNNITANTIYYVSATDLQANTFQFSATIGGASIDTSGGSPSGTHSCMSGTALSYNFTVNWGDGTAESTVTSYNDADRIHTYSSDGTYNVEIKGTCEGWSINYNADYLKLRDVVHWGETGTFNGFKSLVGGFFGCSNMTITATGGILASGTGVETDGFRNTFRDSGITTIDPDLFKYHTGVTTFAYYYTFSSCTNLTTIPADLFKYGTGATTYAFYRCFLGCTLLNSIPIDLFRYNINVSTGAFIATFCGCTALATIPADLFKYNTLASVYGFQQTFQNDNELTTLPADLFRYNTAVAATGFYYTFYGCNKLQLRSDIFYAEGEDTTRFLNRTSNFGNCFDRASFTGTQGTAPDLWNCDYGSTINLDVSPVTDWEVGDIITGQTSGVTCQVVSKTSATVYKVKKITGTYTLGEIVGVTGNANKLADQGATRPTITTVLTKTDCFNGAGNSLTSLTNYADIPAVWL